MQLWVPVDTRSVSVIRGSSGGSGLQGPEECPGLWERLMRGAVWCVYGVVSEV